MSLKPGDPCYDQTFMPGLVHGVNPITAMFSSNVTMSNSPAERECLSSGPTIKYTPAVADALTPGLPVGYDPATGTCTDCGGDTQQKGANALLDAINTQTGGTANPLAPDANTDPWYCSLFGIGCPSNSSGNSSLGQQLMIAAGIALAVSVGLSLVQSGRRR